MILKSNNKNFASIKVLRPIWIKTIDTNEVVVSNKVFFGNKGFKYLISYKYDKKLDL